MLGRLRQVVYYLTPRVEPAEAAWAASLLSGPQQALFSAMGLSDRAHALRVARRLAAQEAPAFVLEAALLHDCAKPPGYSLFWRSLGVALSPWLGEWPAAPRLAGWRGQLQTYRHHDAWSYAAAEAAGGSPEALALLRAYLLGAAEETAAHPAVGPWLPRLQGADDAG